MDDPTEVPGDQDQAIADAQVELTRIGRKIILCLLWLVVIGCLAVAAFHR